LTGGRIWRRVDGVLLLDKASGVSSNSALQAARRLFAAAKAGHTGTLDPLASGLLPLCFGVATRFAGDLLGADKTYVADLLFGVRTDTGDADGVVIARAPVAFSGRDLDAVLLRFQGPIRQVPPMYSALKRNGRPLYDLARQGLEVERAAREVTIHDLCLLVFAGDRCRLRVTCSKGTYIRTLAEDIAAALGCVAHLTALRRTAIAAFTVADAVTLEQLAQLDDEERVSCLREADALVHSLPVLTLDQPACRRFCQGNPVPADVSPGRYRVYAATVLLGLGEVDGAGSLRPRRVVSQAAAQ